jgi:CRP-like cAMP-binding protein
MMRKEKKRGHLNIQIILLFFSFEKEICTLSVGQFFGERALIKEENRAATVECIEDTKVLFLNRHAFRLLLGPLLDVMHRGIEEYEKVEVLPEEKEHETFRIDISQLKSRAILGNLFSSVTCKCQNHH